MPDTLVALTVLLSRVVTCTRDQKCFSFYDFSPPACDPEPGPTTLIFEPNLETIRMHRRINCQNQRSFVRELPCEQTDRHTQRTDCSIGTTKWSVTTQRLVYKLRSLCCPIYIASPEQLRGDLSAKCCRYDMILKGGDCNSHCTEKHVPCARGVIVKEAPRSPFVHWTAGGCKAAPSGNYSLHRVCPRARACVCVCGTCRVAAIRPRGAAADAARRPLRQSRPHPRPVADGTRVGRDRRLAALRQDRVRSARGLPAGLAPGRCVQPVNANHRTRYDTIPYDTRCYFNVRSKADMSQLNLVFEDGVVLGL